MRRRSVSLALGLVAMIAAPADAQRGRGEPRMTLPDVQQQEPREPDRPMFRVGVTRVEVSALVLDRNGAPVRGLTAADFEVLENGVPQVVRSFVPFTHAPGAVVLPDPVLENTDPSRPATSPSSNYYASASRIFALILDDLHVDARRTRVARAAARRLIEQLTPADLLLVMTTSSSESTEYFTRDRQRALQMIDRFAGQRLLDRTIAGKRFPGHDFEAERLDHYERLCGTIRDVSLALREVTGRRKTVVLISEGSSFGAGLSDMTVRMPKATGTGRLNVPTGSSRAMNEALAAAAAGNVSIYPLNPAGLDVPDADLIQVPGLINSDLTAEAYSEILTEARQSKEMARDLAALTGGVSLVDTNDALGAIDRAVGDASSHYVLTYEPEKPATGTEYRTIEVKVRRPDVRVLARRGYTAPGSPPGKAMNVRGLSPHLRTLLTGVVPDDGLPMRVQAVPVIRKGELTTVAVVVEVNGAAFGPERRERGVRLEQGLLTIDGRGKAANGTRRMLDASLSALQWDVLAATALRSVWAVDLPKGRHQLRVASIDATAGRGGSVYLDVEVPEGTGLPPGALVASRLLSMMPTVFADERLARWTTVMPTATRVFPRGDVLTVTVPHSAGQPVAARLADASGQVVWEGPGTRLETASAVQFVVPLDQAGAGVCDLTIESSHGLVRMAIGVVSAGDPKGN